SFKDTTVIVEDGDALLRNIHENISNMMKQKVEAVKSSEMEPQELRYDDSFISGTRLGQRYQAMVQPEETEGYQQDQDQDSPEDGSSKDEESLEADEILNKVSCCELCLWIPNFSHSIHMFQVTDGTEKDPQASQTQLKDKSKLPLYRNRHFYNIPVNTNYSAVHVPSNVYERSKDVISGIIWSEELDKTFKNNYKLDPTLSWQYFGSSTGFMRQFPAMIWSQEPIDLFDCRTRSWYIEAASSPKDIVILVDRSGSMTGMRREIARHVVHNILDTLGNNDYVNIFTFSNTTEALVECFDKQLVQPSNSSRIIENPKKGANCNQAIMLVTDGVQYNYKEIFEKYNWGNLPLYMNVRVFTYLIGREVSDVREVKWMACANQGYYVHLSTYAEVREEVLHYIPVMARPMVLDASQKPNPTWSPVYADKQDNYGDTQTYHLMTSVSLPVYDKKPRQYQGILKPAYNRVDMIEVEILDDESEPRQFDDERRIVLLTRHYYYMGINGTPFSLVIALPHKYGFNRVQHPVENDIHRIRSNDKIKGSLTQFFTGNWTIHPDWHYCRYLDDRLYFENPEEELLHFLRKMEGPGWKWTKECDRKLICKVVADAKITSWFNQNITTSTKEENG
ncbi:hypothetical protein NQ314_012154, partial [Rhamnusium bicolor]